MGTAQQVLPRTEDEMDDILREGLCLEEQHVTLYEDYQDSPRQSDECKILFKEMEEGIQMTFRDYREFVEAKAEMEKELQEVEEVEAQGRIEEAAQRAQQGTRNIVPLSDRWGGDE